MSIGGPSKASQRNRLGSALRTIHLCMLNQETESQTSLIQPGGAESYRSTHTQ